MRKNARLLSQLRPLKVTPNIQSYPYGSALMEMGDTKVICSVQVDENIPSWLKGTKPPQGWITGEYSMLPGATLTRARRERSNHLSGRTQEIQRLIGRSLRGVLDLKLCPDLTFTVDCDVLQADGGTRTASINGGWIALSLAIKKLISKGKLAKNPLIDGVAAVSIGIRGKEALLLDLDYDEDSSVDCDLNIVMTHSGKIIEIQGTGEKGYFEKEQVNAAMDLAVQAIEEIKKVQLACLE